VVERRYTQATRGPLCGSGQQLTVAAGHFQALAPCHGDLPGQHSNGRCLPGCQTDKEHKHHLFQKEACCDKVSGSTKQQCLKSQKKVLHEFPFFFFPNASSELGPAHMLTGTSRMSHMYSRRGGWATGIPAPMPWHTDTFFMVTTRKVLEKLPAPKSFVIMWSLA
jgi:hypothetical protein